MKRVTCKPEQITSGVGTITHKRKKEKNKPTMKRTAANYSQESNSSMTEYWVGENFDNKKLERGGVRCA